MNVEPYGAIGSLDHSAQRPDLRRDLHVFMAYLREHDVKRSHRGNMIPKTDAKRIAKLLSDPNAEEEILHDDGSTWLDVVDSLAFQLGFVKYNTKGVYAGYTSHEPTFPDNFMEVDAKAYGEFVKCSLARQETRLLESYLGQKTEGGSEFFVGSALSRLDRFSSFGCAVGVVPLLDFSAARSFLLKALAALPAGEWLSTASLIAYLKQHNPYFLIPKNPPTTKTGKQEFRRYDNFREGDPYKGQEVAIKAQDHDAWERVEGRYIERFLEGIPYLLGYVDVAYARKLKQSRDQLPSRGGLPAFRVSDRLRRALMGTIAEPTVRITPAFEVYVQSELYPARAIERLNLIGELVSEDATMTFRLTKPKVAAARAADPKLNPVELLESLSSHPLPDNVRRELDDWSQHGEKFVLYSGFSLLETDADVAVPAAHQVECIDPGTYIVRKSDQLFSELEQQERMPLKISHEETGFAPLPEGVRSVLRGKSRKAAAKPASKPQITLMKVTRVQLLCPDRDFLQRLQTLLLGAGCPVEADGKNLSLVYSDRYEAEVGKAIRGPDRRSACEPTNGKRPRFFTRGERRGAGRESLSCRAARAKPSSAWRA